MRSKSTSGFSGDSDLATLGKNQDWSVTQSWVGVHEYYLTEVQRHKSALHRQKHVLVLPSFTRFSFIWKINECLGIQEREGLRSVICHEEPSDVTLITVSVCTKKHMAVILL